MISKENIKEIILEEINLNLKNYKNIELDSYFIGVDSIIESIDIVSFIASVEDRLENLGVEGYDLFDRVFQEETLTFENLMDIIYNSIK
ncbi:hypothetical protein [Prochlorococcus marinus]|uniref:hypothetical protein n=1 Tax=Prochlorococcus marinus TaxID=1219 RepID=UPI001ADAD535|nr:hypothetical protein [Prochlorococcus marinus]MBO8204971.1 hypothetical protein [Prochlorococcus marinus CUG1415]MBW3044244.1 hypothetical protein [Prochlorococcus marinus str. MU1415]